MKFLRDVPISKVLTGTGVALLGVVLGIMVQIYQQRPSAPPHLRTRPELDAFFQPTGATHPAQTMPPALQALLRGFSQAVPGEGKGAWFDPALLAEAVAKHPLEVFQFLFHDAPQELSERLLPEACALLAAADAPTVLRVLGEVRTRSEMQLAWRMVLAAKLKTHPEEALKLALQAPRMAQVGNNFVHALLAAQPPSSLAPLLDQGLPRGWIWGAMDGLKPDRFNAIFTVLKQKLATDWSLDDLRGAMQKTPGDRATAEAVLAHLQTIPKFQNLTGQERLDAAKKLGAENPLMAAVWIASISNGYQRALLKEEALVAAYARQAATASLAQLDPGVKAPTSDLSPLQLVEGAVSNSEATRPILRMATSKAIYATFDGGVSAMSWALTMPDAASQTTALKALFSELKQSKPFAALTYLSQNPQAAQHETFMTTLSQQLQTQFQGRIQGADAQRLREATGANFSHVKSLLEARGLTIPPET